MTMLEDLREVVRRMDEFDTSKYPSASDANRVFCYASADFIRTHSTQIEQDARDAARFRWHWRDASPELIESVISVIDAAIERESK